MTGAVDITACALGGRGVRAAGVGAPLLAVPPAAIEAFAERHRKELRYLNRGAVVTAALLDAVLRVRWPDGAQRPRDVALVVGTAFGNQGETTRSFAAIHAGGADGVAPMASYDVAVNSFVSFAAIFFGLTGIVHTLSSGAASGLDALASACCLLETAGPEAVLVVAIEPHAAEAYAYAGGPTAPSPGLAEAAVVVLLERPGHGAAACGRVLGADVVFVPPAPRYSARALDDVVTRLLRGACVETPPGTVFAGPPWSDGAAVAGTVLRASGADWLDGGDVVSPWAVGAHGMVGAALVLQRLACAPHRGPGLAVTVDPGGWLGAVLLAPPAASCADPVAFAVHREEAPR
jgi:hypothetical protein